MESRSSSRSFFWWTSPRALLRAILMLDDTPHSIALGAAIGMFVSMTPTVGIQMIIIVLFAALTSRLFRFNRVAALLAVYISNPLTVVPIYWFDYKVGCLFFDCAVTHDSFAKLLQYDGMAQWWSTMTALFVEIGAPLIVGSMLVATLLGLITYPATLRLIAAFGKVPFKHATEPRLTAEKSPESNVAETSLP